MKKKINIYKRLTDRIPSLRKKRKAKVMYKFINSNKQKHNKKTKPCIGARLSL